MGHPVKIPSPLMGNIEIKCDVTHNNFFSQTPAGSAKRLLEIVCVCACASGLFGRHLRFSTAHISTKTKNATMPARVLLFLPPLLPTPRVVGARERIKVVWCLSLCDPPAMVAFYEQCGGAYMEGQLAVMAAGLAPATPFSEFYGFV